MIQVKDLFSLKPLDQFKPKFYISERIMVQYSHSINSGVEKKKNNIKMTLRYVYQENIS